MTCSEAISRGGTNSKHYNTTNLRKHLQSHDKEYKEFCEKEAIKKEEAKSKEASFKQLTLDSILEKRKPYPSDHPRVKLLTYHVAEMIVLDLDVMLSAWQFDESRTGANISGAILSRLQEWEIEEKVVCVLRGNTSNMVSGLNIANITSLPCLAHTLQLIIKDGVLLQPAVAQLLSCARSLVGHYHRSNVAFNTV